MRRSGSSPRYARICSANGYMAEAVFPEPTAPTIATPVKALALGLPTNVVFAREVACAVDGLRRSRAKAPCASESLDTGAVRLRNLALCFESKNVHARKDDQISNVGRGVEEEGIGVFEEKKRIVGVGYGAR
jgi:hypothetical protein